VRILRWLAGWFGALVVQSIRLTCRVRDVNDPRPTFRREGTPFVIAILHAHQLSCVINGKEPGLQAMVSRSADGDLLVPTLRTLRMHAVRGSTRTTHQDKGGRAALQQLEEGLRQGLPALIAVDGPRGPRNRVHRGVAHLARRVTAPIIPTVAIASRRKILPRTWDRFQIPLPFARVTQVWGDPIWPADLGVDELRARVGQALEALERKYDPVEAGGGTREDRDPG